MQCVLYARTRPRVKVSDGAPIIFNRLIGCAYFRKHKAVFHPSYPTPMTLFNSLTKTGQDSKTQHNEWLDQNLISVGYTTSNLKPRVIPTSGWKQLTSQTLEVDWDSDTNVSQIRHRVSLIRKRMHLQNSSL